MSVRFYNVAHYAPVTLIRFGKGILMYSRINFLFFSSGLGQTFFNSVCNRITFRSLLEKMQQNARKNEKGIKVCDKVFYFLFWTQFSVSVTPSRQ